MTQQAVRRRHVFFVSGFDPKGAAYYHRLYAQNAAAQALTSGASCEVGRRERTDHPRVQQWQVLWRAEEFSPSPTAEKPEPVHTTYEFLAWDDLVRAHWPKGVAAVAWGSVLAYCAALSSGLNLVRVWRQSRRTLIALAYPAALWLLALTLGIVLGALLGTLAGQFAAQWTPARAGLLTWSVAAAVFIGCGWGALQIEKKLHTSWLLRIYRFADLWARDQLPDLDQRLDAMAERVYTRLQQQDADEVLLAGFSVGSLLTVSVMARVLRKFEASKAYGPDAIATARLSLLTLGQCIPLLGLMPRAQKFRAELETLSAAASLCWIDYSSPTDWGSFALVNPLAMCRIASDQPRQLVPVMRSPRFHTLFNAEDYAQLKKDKRRLHLQYLMASPRPGGYDYFSMTAGPWRLRQSLKPESTL